MVYADYLIDEAALRIAAAAAAAPLLPDTFLACIDYPFESKRSFDAESVGSSWRRSHPFSFYRGRFGRALTLFIVLCIATAGYDALAAFTFVKVARNLGTLNLF